MEFLLFAARRPVAWLVVAVSVVSFAPFAAAQSPSEQKQSPLCVMTYNLRYASERAPNAWPDRRPLVCEVIETAAPDVVGTQEGLHPQLQELAAELPDYNWIGTGRDGGNDGEFMAVFYRKSRLEAVSSGHFWLSDTPELAGSATWGNSIRRMVTWVKFRDRTTDNEFLVFNTHFDHLWQNVREKSARLVRERIAELDTTLPVLLLGDFNASATSNKVYDILTGEDFLKDTWQMAEQRTGDGIGTYNGFRRIPHNGRRIDWILSRGDVQVSEAAIITFERDGQFPSDHFPVMARMQFGKPAANGAAAVVRTANEVE